VINGSVVNSVLSPGVVVDVGAVVRDSIILFDSVIRPGAVVDRSILDKEVAVGPGAIIGEGTDFDVVNRREPGRLNTGITVVGKRAVVPRGVRIGRNVLVGEGVRAADFVSRVIRSGSTVERPREHQPRPGARARVTESSDGHDAPTGVLDPPESGTDAASRSSSGGLRASRETSD
jgi:NDP-sugar pyrophosphorylase family protein